MGGVSGMRASFAGIECRFTGGAGQRVSSPESPAYGALRAIDPVSGELEWEFRYLAPSTAGLLTTA
jgi:hypothetical protein